MTTIDLATSTGDEVVPVVTWVKASEATYWQGQFAQQVASSIASDTDGYRPPHSSTHGPKDAWELARWQHGEERAAAWIVRDLGPNQRRILARLVAAGAEGVWTGELRRAGTYDDGTSMSGVFKAIGGRFRATGHRPIWNGGAKDSQRGQKLTVQDGIAREVFASVIRDAYSDLAVEFGVT